MDIRINVINQKLTFASSYNTYVTGSQKFVKFVFDFNYLDDVSNWDGMSVFAQFYQDDKHVWHSYLNGSKDTILDKKENYVYLPTGVVPGKCILTLYGIKSDKTVVATTNGLTFTITKNNIIEDMTSPDDEVFKPLSERVDALAKYIDEISGNLDSLTKRVDKLEEDMDTVNDEIENLKKQDGDLSDRIDTLSGDVDGLSNDVDDLNDKVTKLLEGTIDPSLLNIDTATIPDIDNYLVIK